MNTADKKVSLEIPLNTQMKIFAFLFQENYSMSELFSGVREVGYYGESQSFSIGTQTNNLSLGITLIQVPGTDTDTGGDSDTGGGTDTLLDNTVPTANVTTATITTSGSAVVQSTETGTAYLVNTTVTVNNNIVNINGAYDNQKNSVAISLANTDTNLPATGPADGTYKVYAVDTAGNLSNASSNSVTVATTYNLPAPNNFSASGTSNTVTLSWNSVSGALSYTLYWDNVSGIDSSDNDITSITNSNYTHNNLDNGSTYYYKVAAVNSSGTGTLSSVKIYITNLWDGLVAHYPFNGNANNVKGNYNGTVNGATPTKGRDNVSNTAYSFDGVNDYIEFGEGVLSGDGEFSILIWINTVSRPTTTSRILQQRDSTGFNGEYMLDILSDGKIKFFTYSNGNKWVVTGNSAVDNGSWHHFAFVQKDNGGQMYLKGSLEDTDNSGGKVNLLSTIKTYVGADRRDWNTSPKYFSGKVDDLRIYSRALSASEIQTLSTIID
jgi:hypothetical protein